MGPIGGASGGWAGDDHGAAFAVSGSDASTGGQFKEVIAFDSDERLTRAALPQTESNNYNHFDPVVEWPGRDRAIEYVIKNPPGLEATHAALSAVA